MPNLSDPIRIKIHVTFLDLLGPYISAQPCYAENFKKIGSKTTLFVQNSKKRRPRMDQVANPKTFGCSDSRMRKTLTFWPGDANKT